MVSLELDNFNIVCTVAGAFITLFGLVSYLLKEKFYLSEALISTLAGVVFSPHATNWIRPLEYARGSEVDLESITLFFSRLVLGVQLVLAGVQLPSKYLWKEKKSLAILLGPGMCIMWVVTSLLVWGLVPNIDLVKAIAVGACVTPTDPVLSSSIVKGKFADKNIPPKLQRIVIAESGANDGLGYPFVFLGLYLLKYAGDGGVGSPGGVGKAFALWFYDTWAYVIILSVVYGAVVGWLAKVLLRWAEERHYVDRESFLVFAIALALFIIGTMGMLHSDDVLACFIAGNAFTWDDWFRQETEDDSLQPTIDMLLNVSIFVWYGAVCPWHMFVDNNVIPIYRLIPLGILVLLLRRLPMVLSFHKAIHQIDEVRHAGFVGFFGPIGVSAIFYLYTGREFLRTVVYDGHERADASQEGEVLEVVVWFLVTCSILVHGLSIPLGKLGIYLPRTISTAISSEAGSRASSQTRGARQDPDEPEMPFHMDREARTLTREFRRRRPTTTDTGPSRYKAVGWGGIPAVASNVFSRLTGHAKRERGATVPDHDSDHKGSSEESPEGHAESNTGARPEISGPRDGRVIGKAISEAPGKGRSAAAGKQGEASARSGASTPVGRNANDPPMSEVQSPTASGAATPTGMHMGWQRSIRFPDEGLATPQRGQSPSRGKS